MSIQHPFPINFGMPVSFRLYIGAVGIEFGDAGAFEADRE